MTDTVKITEASLAVFLAYADDARNWNGTPLVSGTKEERGNLIQLKKAGLIKTFSDDGMIWVVFQDAGKKFAAEHGIDLD